MPYVERITRAGKTIEVDRYFTSQYKKKGINDVSMKLYPDDRHEILNELDREQVYSDILRWLDKKSDNFIDNIIRD